jgi:glycosyltransferase involved in cell wall biosynthesis
MNMPLVSVLIPAYNHEKYIEACLESVLLEGYPNLEVLIVDDGSKDQTHQIALNWCASHKDSFQHCEVFHQENHGLVVTLNRLVRMSHGEFVTLLASDDALIPGGIAVRLTVLQKRHDWMAVFADAEGMNADGQTTHNSVLSELYLANRRALSDDRLRSIELILRWSVPGPVFLARRSCYEPEHIGLYDDSLAFEDRDFYLRLLSKRALGFLDAVVARYRMHETNLTRAVDLDQSQLVKGEREMQDSAFRNLSRFRGFERLALYLNWKTTSARVVWFQDASVKNVFPRLKLFVFRQLGKKILDFRNFTYLTIFKAVK